MDFLKRFFGFFWELAKVAVVALVLAGLVRYFLVQPFFVDGASMEPNFEDGEYLLVDEASYYFREVGRGEVVVFHYPLDTSKYYIKRVIGLPGETVEIKDGAITIYNNENPGGFILEEPYVSELARLGNTLFGNAAFGNTKKKLEQGEYFVLGDNRPASSDSRRWGVLPRADIVGRVWLRAWPVARASILEAPVYQTNEK